MGRAQMMDYQPLITRWQHGEMARWAQLLEPQIAAGLCQQRYGDLARWLQALRDLPPLQAGNIHLDTSSVGASSTDLLTADSTAQLRHALQAQTGGEQHAERSRDAGAVERAFDLQRREGGGWSGGHWFRVTRR